MYLWFDIETDGLSDEYTKVWCMSLINNKGKTYDFILDGFEEEGIAPVSTFNYRLKGILEESKSRGKLVVCCHNMFCFDLPAMFNLISVSYGFDWWGAKSNKVYWMDTLDLSQSLYPDRPMPKGCPTSILNPVTGKRKRVGAHGLEAWSYRTAGTKPVIHDWRDGHPMKYLERCREDALNTKLTFEMLMEEMER